ncbi:MAG: hypothetical protein Q7S99_15640 [Parvibaculum sp.]|nr:hypothetical protein [Parvibaculum sp.]|tara:strand:- start:12669 stop:13034 length:366 start_codon:yes stop_codon:yes gene_type:complete
MYDIDFGPLAPMVSEILLAVLTALASFVVAKLCQWLKAKRDGELGAILDKALAMGIAFAMSRLTDWTQGRTSLEVKNELAADAANYVLVHVPDAVKALKLDGEHLTRMIEARLQVARGADT